MAPKIDLQDLVKAKVDDGIERNKLAHRAGAKDFSSANMDQLREILKLAGVRVAVKPDLKARVLKKYPFDAQRNELAQAAGAKNFSSANIPHLEHMEASKVKALPAASGAKPTASGLSTSKPRPTASGLSSIVRGAAKIGIGGGDVTSKRSVW